MTGVHRPVPVKVTLEIAGSAIESQWGSLEYPG